MLMYTHDAMRAQRFIVADASECCCYCHQLLFFYFSHWIERNWRTCGEIRSKQWKSYCQTVFHTHAHPIRLKIEARHEFGVQKMRNDKVQNYRLKIQHEKFYSICWLDSLAQSFSALAFSSNIIAIVACLRESQFIRWRLIWLSFYLCVQLDQVESIEWCVTPIQTNLISLQSGHWRN